MDAESITKFNKGNNLQASFKSTAQILCVTMTKSCGYLLKDKLTFLKL